MFFVIKMYTNGSACNLGHWLQEYWKVNIFRYVHKIIGHKSGRAGFRSSSIWCIEGRFHFSVAGCIFNRVSYLIISRHIFISINFTDFYFVKKIEYYKGVLRGIIQGVVSQCTHSTTGISNHMSSGIIAPVDGLRMPAAVWSR